MKTLTVKDINDYCANLGIIKEQLTQFTVPDGVTNFDIETFWGCTALTSITIPDSVTKIGDHDSVTKIGDHDFESCNSLTFITLPNNAPLTQIICNNPDLFNDKNVSNKDQIQFISIGEYLENNYKELLNKLKSSEFNTEYVSSKELDLIIKLHQKDYQPKWETIAETFENRSMNQIKDILHYFGKTQSMPEFFDTVGLDANNDKPVNLNHLSMFLTPSEQKNLTDATTDATIKPKKSQSG